MGNGFSENLKRLRKEKGMTQEQLAETVGVTAQVVSKWELTGYPDAGLLPAVADALAYQEIFVELFRFLGMPDVLRALVFLAEQRQNIFFDCNMLEEELSIDQADAEEIIAGLLKFKFVVRAELKKGKENEVIYQYRLDGDLISFLTFTRLLLKRPCSFQLGIHNRNSPYFQNGSWKKI